MWTDLVDPVTDQHCIEVPVSSVFAKLITRRTFPKPGTRRFRAKYQYSRSPIRTDVEAEQCR